MMLEERLAGAAAEGSGKERGGLAAAEDNGSKFNSPLFSCLLKLFSSTF
jgi:hypothetical protein